MTGFTFLLVGVSAFAAGLAVARFGLFQAQIQAFREAIADRDIRLAEFRTAYEQRARELQALKHEISQSSRHPELQSPADLIESGADRNLHAEHH